MRIRSNALAAGVVTTAVSRLLAAVIPLLVVPIALRELGSDGYGAWAAAVSLTSLIAFADLGVGTGLMTRLGAVVEDGKVLDEAAARRFVASGYAVVAGVAAILVVVLTAVAMVGDFSALLGVHGSEASVVESVMVITLAAFPANMVAQLVVRVQYAVGLQAQANIWQMLGSLAMLGSVLVLGQMGSERPVAFAALTALAPITVAAATSVIFFKASPVGRQVAPRISAITRETTGNLLLLGSRYLVVSVLMTATVVVDPFIVARTSALQDVPEYAIASRVFTVIGTVGVMLSLPLWPLHARAVEAGDVAWIRRMTIRMTLVSGAAVLLGSVGALLIGRQVLAWWLGGAVDFDMVLWAGLGMWWFVQAVLGPAFMVQNGAGVLGPQMIGYALLLLVALPVKWVLGATWGFVWIPWGGAALYVLFLWPAAAAGFKRAMTMARARQAARVDEAAGVSEW